MSELYEVHITCMTSDSEVATKVAKELHWKTREIARDPVLGNDTYFYLTTHGTDYGIVVSRLRETVGRLHKEKCKVIREKIEKIVYDTKTGIGV